MKNPLASAVLFHVALPARSDAGNHGAATEPMELRKNGHFIETVARGPPFNARGGIPYDGVEERICVSFVIIMLYR